MILQFFSTFFLILQFFLRKNFLADFLFIEVFDYHNLVLFFVSFISYFSQNADLYHIPSLWYSLVFLFGIFMEFCYFFVFSLFYHIAEIYLFIYLFIFVVLHSRLLEYPLKDPNLEISRKKSSPRD